MEPEVREFLVKIVQSISMFLVWFLINMSMGIYYGFAFFEERPSLGNYLFYLWLLISFTLLIFYLSKKWKGWQENNY